MRRALAGSVAGLGAVGGRGRLRRRARGLPRQGLGREPLRSVRQRRILAGGLARARRRGRAARPGQRPAPLEPLAVSHGNAARSGSGGFAGARRVRGDARVGRAHRGRSGGADPLRHRVVGSLRHGPQPAAGPRLGLRVAPRALRGLLGAGRGSAAASRDSGPNGPGHPARASPGPTATKPPSAASTTAGSRSTIRTAASSFRIRRPRSTASTAATSPSGSAPSSARGA